MDIFTKEDLAMLVDNQGGRCVSLYIPTHRTGSEAQKNQIRFKNALRKAEEMWERKAGNGGAAAEVFKPARQLLEDTPFWSYQGDGLSFFLTPAFFRAYRLPLYFDEIVVLTDRFHLKPLLPLVSRDLRFYVLALSLKKVRLIECNQQQAREIELEEIPGGIDTALRYDEVEKQLQYHTRTRGRAGGDKRRAMFHGQGAGTDDAVNNVLRYFQQVDRGVREVVAGRNIPMILAGLEYLPPIYREANNYPHLADEEVTGNTDPMRGDELCRRAWEVMEPRFSEARSEAVERYRQLAETDDASGDLREIVPAAYHGRVDTLFVATGVQQWGTYDPDTDTVDLHQRETDGDGDLLDFAAVHTLMKGGTVHIERREEMPGNTLAAAVYRY